MSIETISLSETLPENSPVLRLDQACHQLFSDYSRSQWQEWIKTGYVSVNQTTISKPRHKVTPGDIIAAEAKRTDHADWKPEDIPITCCYEDDDLLVINKAEGLICHPGAGIYGGTLVNGLLFHYPELKPLPRAGLIHRLDKDTTGLLIIAKTDPCYHALNEMMRERLINRQYQAIVHGNFISGGTLTTPYGRHPTARIKMAVLARSNREATTHYRVLTRFDGFTHLEVTLDTGRTHQIRVHMAHLRHPILGDSTYGKRCHYPKLPESAQTAITSLKRQALHAQKLQFLHPMSNEPLSFEAPLPADMQTLLDHLPKPDYK